MTTRAQLARRLDRAGSRAGREPGEEERALAALSTPELLALERECLDAIGADPAARPEFERATGRTFEAALAANVDDLARALARRSLDEAAGAPQPRPAADDEVEVFEVGDLGEDGA